MITVLIKTVTTFLAIYGLFYIIKDLIGFIFGKSSKKSDDIAVVIKVKNAADKIESTVRTIILKSLTNTFGGHIPDIIIVDMGSDDETSSIAKKLSEDYSFVYYTTYELYEKAKG